MNIVQVRGHTAPYLELSPGEPTHNLLKLAREGLIAGLGKAIRAAKQTNAVAKEDGFRIEGRRPLKRRRHQGDPVHGLVLFRRNAISWFRSKTPSRMAGPRPWTNHPNNGRESARLRRELAATKRYLQTIVDDKASTLEALRAANEEAQAGNEELRNRAGRAGIDQ
jgi:two-component system CheB/CheR fusion protein